MQKEEHNFKLLLIGSSNVGKSSILLRFTNDTYNADQSATIGVDFNTKMLDIDGTSIVCTIWDTAGQEKFRSLTSSYYRGTHGIAVVYDVSKRESFEDLDMWINEADLHSTNKNVIKLLIGNKIDKEDERVISHEEGAEYARKNSMLFIECSAKTKLGIQQAFEELVQKILDTPPLWQHTVKKNIDVNKKQEEQPVGCCGFG